MKIFPVTISYTTMIRAEDEVAASYMAKDLAREIVGDANDPDSVLVHKEITESSQLERYGDWSGNCLPYGDVDGDKMISEYLGEL